MLGIGEWTLTPGALEVFPWLSGKPTITIGVGFGSVFAELVDDRCATDDGLEARGFTFYKTGHLAAVTVADQRHAVAVDRLGVKHFVDAGHDVEVVSVAHIIFVGGLEGHTVSSAAARVRDQDCPALSNQEVGEGQVGIDKLAGGATVDVDYQRHMSC